MMMYHNNKRVKVCGDCPFCVEFEAAEGFFETFCEPIKPKYGHNPISKESKPNRLFCRLSNTVTGEFVLDFGKFKGKTVYEVLVEAPKYIQYLIEHNAIKVVNSLPTY